MATDFEIVQTPEGIRTVREKRFAFHEPSPSQEQREWVEELERYATKKKLIEEYIRRQQEAIHSSVALSHRFQQLVTQWRNETGHFSLMLKRAMHPSYQEIIGMGEKALPFILRELRDRPSGHWFWALRAITGQDITKSESDIDRAIQLWLDWGSEHSYV